MKTKISFLQPIVFCLFLSILACKKDNEDGDSNGMAEPIGSSKNKPGLGDNPGLPEGTVLQLPSCIRMVDRPNYKFKVNETKVYGSMQTFYMPVSFVNSCCGAVDVDLPDGLMLTSDTGPLQNGILIERVFFTVDPTYCGGGDTTTIYLAVACLNENRTPPISRYSADYNIGDFGYVVGKVTNDANLLKFLALLKDKPGLRVSGFVTNNPPDPGTETPLQKMYSAIQQALWKITDGNGLTADEVKKLQQMLENYD